MGISYCGINCGECIKGNPRTAVISSELLCLMDKSDLDNWQANEPRSEGFDYPSLRKGLKWMARRMHCTGCKEGGGMAACSVRACAKGKKLSGCGECPDMPCAIVEQFKGRGIDVKKNFSKR